MHSCVTQYHIDNIWTYENPTAYYPRLNANGNKRSKQIQTKYLQNAAYIRLKDITFELYFTQELVDQDENGAGTYLCKWYEFVGENRFAPIYDSLIL